MPTSMELFKQVMLEIRGLREDMKARDGRCMERGKQIAVLMSRQEAIEAGLNNRRKLIATFAIRTMSHIIAARALPAAQAPY